MTSVFAHQKVKEVNTKVLECYRGASYRWEIYASASAMILQIQQDNVQKNKIKIKKRKKQGLVH
jgi:hypothetical protein